MPNIMESFASGAQAVAAPEQARASIQAAQLQQQYMPEGMRLDLLQKQQATSEQSMKLSMLADTIKADKEIAPKLQEFVAKNPNATESETNSELSKIYISIGRPKEAIAFSNAASKAKHEETLSKLDEYKLADEKMDAGRFAIMSLDPSDPAKWNQGLMDYTTKTPGANRGPIDALVSKNIAAGMSEEQARQSAQATLVPLMKTSKQALADKVAAIKEKQEADSAKRIDLQTSALMARIQSQQATLALGYAREDRMNKQETNKEAKAADDKRTKERLLFDDQRKSFESLHTKYLKARGLATSSDDKIALDETYQQDLESKNGEFRNEFARLGIPYTEMATPHTAAAKPVGAKGSPIKAASGETPPYGAWAASARSLNPNASPEELKAAYEKRYGSKTEGKPSSTPPEEMSPDLRKEYGDINMRLSLPRISDTKKLELLLRKKEIEKSLSKPWKKYD